MKQKTEARARRVAARAALGEIRRGEGFHSHKLVTELGTALDPFLSIEHFHMTAPTFAPHPHAGLAGVTYLFERSAGALVSRESSGERRRIDPGAVRWLEAGRGMVHEEGPDTPGPDCHGVQTLVNLAAADKGAAPRVFHLEAAQIPQVAPGPGVRVRVVSGEVLGVRSSIASRAPVTLLDVYLSPGASLACPLPAEHVAFAIALAGRGEVGPREEAAWLEPHGAAAFAAGDGVVAARAGEAGLHLWIAAGRPYGEPVVFEGPLAMPSREALAEAWARHAAGEMGRLDAVPPG